MKPLVLFLQSLFLFTYCARAELTSSQVQDVDSISQSFIRFEDFATVFRRLAKENNESLGDFVVQLQEQRPYLAHNLIFLKDYWKLSFLLDHGWEWAKKYEGEDLLDRALKQDDLKILERVLRAGAHERLKDMVVRNYPAPKRDLCLFWKNRADDPKFIEQIPQDFSYPVVQRHSGPLPFPRKQAAVDNNEETLALPAPAPSPDPTPSPVQPQPTPRPQQKPRPRGDSRPTPKATPKAKPLDGLVLDANDELPRMQSSPLGGEEGPNDKIEGSPKGSKKAKIRPGVKKEESGNFTVQIPYGTNRAFDGSIQPFESRSAVKYFAHLDSGAVHYGLAEVNIPKNHKRLRLESPSPLAIFTKGNPDDFVSVKKLSPMEEGQFLEKLRALNPEGQNLFVYIHGFNVDFPYAIRRTAQLVFDMKFPGLSLAYSWPARPVRVPISADFLSDVARARVSTPYLKAFLKNVRREFPNQTIHLVAHSLGTRVLSQVLFELRKEMGDELFGEVIYASPAIDAKVFRDDWLADILKVCKRFSIFSSNDDVALKAQIIAEDLVSFPLGLWSAEKAALFEGVFHFDLSGLSTGIASLEHSKYSDIGQAIDHIAYLLKEDPTEEDLDGLAYTERLERLDSLSSQSRSYWKILE